MPAGTTVAKLSVCSYSRNYAFMKSNHSLTQQLPKPSGALLIASAITFGPAMALPVRAADDRAAVSTINHAFATELGTGVYDIAGRSVFIASITPAYELREGTETRAGVRLVFPMSGGSFNFRPDDAIDGKLPNRIDSYSVMPGFEFDFPLHEEWVLTPWLRAGASFAEGSSDGLLWGIGARVGRELTFDAVSFTQRHEVGLVAVNYHDLPNDRFLRQRNAFDLRQPTFPIGFGRRLLVSAYSILDVVPDPPAAPAGVKPSVVQLEAGVTFNGDPRPQIWSWRWPRLGFGYRVAGEFSGWRIVIGAPF
jgi:hypothetical protein